MKINKICKFCKNNFESDSYKNSKYCSYSCRNKGISIFQKELYSTKKSNLVNLNLIQVGKNNPFFGKKHKDETKKIMSEKAKKRSGKLANRYIDGRTPIDKLQRLSKNYKEWRINVFKKDKFCCKLCGSKGVILNAHHKFKWSDFPKFRFDINNGTTLCENCHKFIHKKH